jgi:hypothetical protein
VLLKVDTRYRNFFSDIGEDDDDHIRSFRDWNSYLTTSDGVSYLDSDVWWGKSAAECARHGFINGVRLSEWDCRYGRRAPLLGIHSVSRYVLAPVGPKKY